MRPILQQHEGSGGIAPAPLERPAGPLLELTHAEAAPGGLIGAEPAGLAAPFEAELDAAAAPASVSGTPSKVARNVFATLAAQLVSWGATLLVALYVPRYIGPQGYGVLNIGGAFASFATILAALGTSTVLIREIARDHAILRREVVAGLTLRLVFGAAAVLFGLAAAWGMGYSRVLLEVVGVYLASMLVGQLGDVLSCALQGLERMPQQNAALLAGRIVTAALQIFAVMAHLPLVVVAGTVVVGALVNTGYALICLLPWLRGAAWPTRGSMAGLFRAGLPFLSVAVFLGIYAQSDSILLSKLCSIRVVGWYGLARTLIGSTLFIPVAVCSAMLPTLSRMYLESREQFAATVARVMNLMLICVTPFVALLIFAPRQILAFIHYPPSFDGSIPVLMAMAGAALMWYVSQVAGTALAASDRQGQLSRATSLGAAICLPTSIVCILAARHWLHNGAIGAAVSNGLVECAIFSGYVRSLPPGIVGWRSLSVLGRSVLASLPLVAWLYCVHDRLWFALGAVPCALIYAGLCWAMKCFHGSDVEMLRQMVRRKVAG